MDKILETMELVRRELAANRDRHWIIGYSGGKDSTAVLKLLLAAARLIENCNIRFTIIYCDTGVENPLIGDFAKSTLAGVAEEYRDSNINVDVRILKAPVSERFFVKVIGRGYPTPTNSFRWCTKALRIKPVSNFITDSSKSDAIVVVGSRLDESNQRKRSLGGEHAAHWQRQRETSGEYDLFMPILKFTVSDVWDCNFAIDEPRAVNTKRLEEIYWGASDECPIIKSPESAPCASGRFGCWTCTVVRRDHSAERLIAAGHQQLQPFLDFRNWLSTYRDRKDMRWPKRRNGTQFPGPFNLEARGKILERVRRLERAVNQEIVSIEELNEIHRLWQLDATHECENRRA